MSTRQTTNGMARHLLAANEQELERLAPALVDRVAERLGAPAPPVDHHWPVDIVAATREFLTCVAMDDVARIAEPEGIFEQVGAESARGGLPFEHLAAGIREAVRRTQTQVHRAVIAEGLTEDTEAVLGLLTRVVTAGEAVVEAARHGHEIVSVAGHDHDDLDRRLATALIAGQPQAAALIAQSGWRDGDLACAVLAPVGVAARVRRDAGRRVPYYPRGEDIVLVHPVRDGRLATTLRPTLVGATAVGPAVPLADFTQSLALAQRAVPLAPLADGPVFADDHLLELACSADPAVVSALRRKHLVGLEDLPADHRDVLARTLQEWLLQWGHRPGIAAALHVHPQTVSGRISRLKDLLADDLEDPRVRSELLVLLIADTGEIMGATRPGQ